MSYSQKHSKALKPQNRADAAGPEQAASIDGRWNVPRDTTWQFEADKAVGRRGLRL